MQLSMTAPLDIGLEQSDASLSLGQEDLFDLGGAEKGLRRHGGLSKLKSVQDASSVDEEVKSGDNEGPDEEDEEADLVALEGDLDGMYEAYQGRLRERDAKFRVAEARKNNPRFEEWHGTRPMEEDSDDDEEEGQAGGWDEVQRTKAELDESSSDESHSEDPETQSNRRRTDESTPRPSKRARLVSSLADKAPVASQNSRVWFSQDIFGGIGDPDDLNPQDSNEDIDMDDEADEDELEVSKCMASAEPGFISTRILTSIWMTWT